MIFAWIKAYFLRMIKRPAIIGIIAATVIISVVLSGLSKGAMSGFACGILKSDDENIIFFEFNLACVWLTKTRGHPLWVSFCFARQTIPLNMP